MHKANTTTPIDLSRYGSDAPPAWWRRLNAMDVLYALATLGLFAYGGMKNRDLMGATNPKEAAAGTIRADFADSIDANAVHGSDSLENAAIEIAYFFPATDVYGR